MKLLGIVLAVQVALGITLVALVATDNLPFTGDHEADGQTPRAATVSADRFNGAAAFRLLRRQVELGPRPAGSPESRRLARLLKRIVPRGEYQEVPGGLRNVVGTVSGREPGYVVVAAHYDTKDVPGFVGANDGASGTAVAAQLARSIRRPRHTVKFVFLDGEESPRGTPDRDFEKKGLRGSKVAAKAFADARAMVLLDFVGDRRAHHPLRGQLEPGPVAEAPQRGQSSGRARGVPARRPGPGFRRPPSVHRGRGALVDLIDFDFPCWHRRCDDMSAVSQGSVNAVGETIYELLRSL